MRVDNIRWHPVRLGLTRAGPNVWRVSRDGQLVGGVRRYSEGWFSFLAPPADGRARHPSFVAAVLRVSRLKGIWASSDGPQDFGLVHMLRINAATRWYTVIIDAVRGDRYLYEDHTIRDQTTDEEQAVLRLVLVEVDRHLGRRG